MLRTPPSPPPGRPPGRPKDQEKRAAILATANTLFMDHGYEGVTMEAVAAAAGVSKMTVYAHFHDKAALFGAVVCSVTDQMVTALTRLAEAEEKPDLEASLVAFGTALLELTLSPRIVVMSHMLMGMLMKDHSLAEMFYEAGPCRIHTALATFLAEVAPLEGLAFDSPQAAADDLISLWQGDMPKQVALGLIPPVTPTDIERRVRRGMMVFLRAYRANPGEHPGIMEPLTRGA